VQGRTNHLLFFHATRIVYKTAIVTIPLSRGDMFSNPLPSNDKVDTHADTQSNGKDL
jgi:hypothetical protein